MQIRPAARRGPDQQRPQQQRQPQQQRGGVGHGGGSPVPPLLLRVLPLAALLAAAEAKRRAKEEPEQTTPMDTAWAAMKPLFAFSPFIGLGIFMVSSMFEGEDKEKLKRAKKHGMFANEPAPPRDPAEPGSPSASSCGGRLPDWRRHRPVKREAAPYTIGCTSYKRYFVFGFHIASAAAAAAADGSNLE